MKELKFKQFEINEINKITLLSIEEAKKIPKPFRACHKQWWLQSPGICPFCVVYVNDMGDVMECGDFVFDIHFVVRPAFKINNLKSEIGDKIMVGKTWCTVIDENLVLADYPICEHKFDEKSNDWENSELKAFMNSEEFISLL